jgi:hypothetical protein
MLSGRGKAGWGIDNHGYHEADMIGAVDGDAPRDGFLDLGFGQWARSGLEEAEGGGRRAASSLVVWLFRIALWLDGRNKDRITCKALICCLTP